MAACEPPPSLYHLCLKVVLVYIQCVDFEGLPWLPFGRDLIARFVKRGIEIPDMALERLYVAYAQDLTPIMWLKLTRRMLAYDKLLYIQLYGPLITSLTLSECHIDSAQVYRLNTLANLQWLDLSDTNCDQTSLMTLANGLSTMNERSGLQNLVGLALRHIPLHDRSLLYLNKFPRLCFLEITQASGGVAVAFFSKRGWRQDTRSREIDNYWTACPNFGRASIPRHSNWDTSYRQVFCRDCVLVSHAQREMRELECKWVINKLRGPVAPKWYRPRLKHMLFYRDPHYDHQAASAQSPATASIKASATEQPSVQIRKRHISSNQDLFNLAITARSRWMSSNTTKRPKTSLYQ